MAQGALRALTDTARVAYADTKANEYAKQNAANSIGSSYCGTKTKSDSATTLGKKTVNIYTTTLANNDKYKNTLNYQAGYFGMSVAMIAVSASLEGGSTLSKAEILKQNKIAGTAAEKLAAQQLLDDGYNIIGSQVSVRTSGGRRIIDHLVLDSAGDMMAIEVKSGNAVRSNAQLFKDMLLETEGGVLTGKNVGELSGQFIQIPTREMRIPR
ncbi:MAG: nuclease-related domain-containing protein [Aminipila sp.]